MKTDTQLYSYISSTCLDCGLGAGFSLVERETVFKNLVHHIKSSPRLYQTEYSEGGKSILHHCNESFLPRETGFCARSHWMPWSSCLPLSAHVWVATLPSVLPSDLVSSARLRHSKELEIWEQHSFFIAFLVEGILELVLKTLFL